MAWKLRILFRPVIFSGVTEDFTLGRWKSLWLETVHRKSLHSGWQCVYIANSLSIHLLEYVAYLWTGDTKLPRGLHLDQK